MCSKGIKWAKLADQIEQSSAFRLFRIVEAVAIVVALIAFGLELKNRQTDRAIRVASLHSQIAQTLTVPGGRFAVRASVRALADEGISMAGMYLVGADLEKLDLTRTHLVRVNFADANLVDVDFGGADLSGANFAGANISRVNFDGAIITGAKFENAHVGNTMRIDGRLVGEGEIFKNACYIDVRPTLPQGFEVP